MPNWKKVIVSGSNAELNQITGSGLQLTSLPSQASEATSLMIGASGNIGTRELGTNAFNSTAFTTCTGTVTSVTSGNTNTIFIGGTATAPTISANTSAVINGGLNLANGAAIYDHVTSRISGLTSCTGTVTGTGADNRVATWSGTNSLDSNSAFTYDGTTLTVGSKATIGSSHTNTGTNSTIAGGTLNTASAACSFIGGGQNNSISDYYYGTIVGGCNNTISGYGNSSAIVGGSSNTLSDAYCGFIGGGFNNCLTDAQIGQVIVGGRDNEVRGSCSGILGGTSNTVSNTNSFIIGSNLTSTANCYTFMNNACVAGTTRTTTLVETSARKYKECILPLQDQIENIKKLEPVEFQWKKDKTKDIGFIAEEVKEIFPNLVAYEEDGEISGVQYSKLTTVLVKALQQQQEQIEELKKEIFIIKNNLNG